MAIKIEGFGPHIFPYVDFADANPTAGAVEMILMTTIGARVDPVVVKLTKRQAADLAKVLARAAS